MIYWRSYRSDEILMQVLEIDRYKWDVSKIQGRKQHHHQNFKDKFCLKNHVNKISKKYEINMFN